MSLEIPSESEILVNKSLRWNTFCLDYDIWTNTTIPGLLQWKQIKFGDRNIDDLDSKEGIYMFIAKPPIAYNENHSYILYIGETKDLKRRYLEYLNTYNSSTHPSDQLKRKMVIIWRNYLFFNYLEMNVGGNKKKREKVEYDLIDTIVPPFNDKFRSKVVNANIKLYRNR